MRKINKINMQGGEKKQKNLKGVFFTDKMGVKKFVFMNAMIFVFRTFMKNTPL